MFFVETRKIVKSGNTSFVLSLPIGWIRKHNLKQGSIVNLSENESGNITISSGEATFLTKKEFVTIKVDGKYEEDIYLELMIAYVRDAATIIFEGNEICSKDTKIIDFVKTFIGLDIMERSMTSIMVKNFFILDKEVSPDILLRRMDVVNRASMELLDQYFKKGFAREDLFELQKLNEQNTRLFNLFRKCVLKIVENPAIMSTLKTNHLQLTKNRICSQAFARISHFLLTIGIAFQIIDIDQKTANLLKSNFHTMTKTYKSVVSSISNKMYEDIKRQIIEISGEYKKLEKDLKILDDPLAVQVTSAMLNVYYELQAAAFEEIA
jgi:dimeric dUTPase (all-alpha-NTP-PPase superfamily)